MKKLMNWSKN